MAQPIYLFYVFICSVSINGQVGPMRSRIFSLAQFMFPQPRAAPVHGSHWVNTGCLHQPWNGDLWKKGAAQPREWFFLALGKMEGQETSPSVGGPRPPCLQLEGLRIEIWAAFFWLKSHAPSSSHWHQIYWLWDLTHWEFFCSKVLWAMWPTFPQLMSVLVLASLSLFAPSIKRLNTVFGELFKD